jgi:hypothetical protein
MEFSVRPPSPPTTYSYVQEENLGSTRKFVENHLLFTCITNKILALCTYHTPAERSCLRGEQKRKLCLLEDYLRNSPRL